MIRFIFLRVLLALGIAANVAFLFINLKPVRPHIGKRHRAKILVRADPSRAQWIKQNQLADFEATNDIDIEVIAVATWSEVATILETEKKTPSGLMLATVSDRIAGAVQKAGAIVPLDDGLGRQEVADALAEYLPEAAERSMGTDKHLWFVPRRADLDIAVFRRDAVEDAFLNWETQRPAIQAALAEVNGFGLPEDYTLDRSPSEWNSYDLFVAGWYWAHSPAPWASPSGDPKLTAPAPRIGLRTGNNDDATTDLLELFYQHGLTQAQLGQMDATPVLEALQWLALFRKYHLLAPECERAEGINSDGVNELFKANRLAWAPIIQEDALWLHGGARVDADPGIQHPEELGWAPLPVGVSLELNDNCADSAAGATKVSNAKPRRKAVRDPKGGMATNLKEAPAIVTPCVAGKPKRTGTSFAFNELQYWALPVNSRESGLAWQLARYLTGRGLQQRETEAQGMLPVRRDLRDEYPILFRLGWMQEILHASYDQLDRGSSKRPDSQGAQSHDEDYASLYQHVVVERADSAPLTLAAIRAAALKAHGH